MALLARNSQGYPQVDHNICAQRKGVNLVLMYDMDLRQAAWFADGDRHEKAGDDPVKFR